MPVLLSMTHWTKSGLPVSPPGLFPPWTHSASPRKMHGWIVLVRENCSVNKRFVKNKQLKFREVLSLFFFNYFFDFDDFHLKKLKIIQLIFEENLVVNNKDNGVIMSRNYRSDGSSTETLCSLISRVFWFGRQKWKFPRFSQVLKEHSEKW